MLVMRPSIIRLRWRFVTASYNANRQRRHLIQQRRQARAALRLHYNPFEVITDEEFVKTFRLKKTQVVELIRVLKPLLPRPLRLNGISPDLKVSKSLQSEVNFIHALHPYLDVCIKDFKYKLVLIALGFYATGSYQTLVGQSALHNVSQASVSRAVRQVTEALNKIVAKHIKWPLELNDRNAIKAKFYHQFHIPGVLGCIDGTHVAILRPEIHEERYYNRKGYHSLNVMIICDSDLNILCMDASNPGSAHDSMVWQGHPLSSHLRDLSNDGEQVFLLGDSGYPLRATMMTPILNTMEGTADHYYYQKHVTARNSVERCIGLLKARFRCLLAARALHYDPITAGKIINACCVLHNIANKNRVPVTPLTPEEAEAENQRQHQVVDMAPPENLLEGSRRVNPELQRGRLLQQALVERLWRERLI